MRDLRQLQARRRGHLRGERASLTFRPSSAPAVFNGVYHVLGGVLAPMEGVGPGDLRIAELMARLGREDVTEVVLCHEPQH